MKDVIVFKHIGKTGGTSLRHSILDAVEHERILLCYARGLEHPRCLLRDECEAAKRGRHDAPYREGVDKLLAEDDKLDLIYGHFVPSEITSRNGRYFGMMRHPYTRVLSLYHRALRQWPDETSDFESWVKGPFTDILIGTVCFDKRMKGYESFEKILFYEEYQEGLAYMSGLLGVELKEQRQNIHPKVVERSVETDRLIDEYCSDMLHLYDHFWSKR
jgi:hypothetical protein